MITIFTLPKPFTDPHIRIIQRNAIMSWKKLDPGIEIMLMGNDPGIKETAEEFGVVHIPNVKVNEFGTPMLDSAFNIAREKALFETVMYVNADIIFVRNLVETIPRLPKNSSLTIGRRTDFDITNEIDFDDLKWEEKILRELKEKGKLHSYAGIDYFIFNKHLFQNLPSFAVGRPGWDNWTVRESRKSHKYTIDATKCITAIHENHGYIQRLSGKQRKINPEALQNRAFIKHPSQTFTIEDANWILTPNKIKRNYLCWLPFLKRYLKSFKND